MKIMKISNFIYITTTLAVLITTADAGYTCQPKTCDGEEHSLCIWPNLETGPLCGDGPETQWLSDEEKEAILDSHNQLRRRVASGQEDKGNPGPQPAGNIPDLEWDSDLEYTAQAWANQCSKGHDKCRDFEEYQVGQNNGWTSKSDKYGNMPEIVENQWYAEVKNFNGNSVDSFYYPGGPEIRHYTQVVWGETRKVGCGAVRYRESVPGQSGLWYSIRLICNYGPSGNVETLPVYETN